MKGGSKLFLVAGIGLAVVAIGILVMGMSSGGKKADATKQQAKVEETMVVQAAADVPAHTILKSTDLLEVKVATTQAPPDAPASVSEVVGQSYKEPLLQGQTLVRGQLEEPGIHNDIEKGMRAMSIPVNELSMLNGLVQDDDYIDIVFQTRITLIRILPTTFAETAEDGAGYTPREGEGATTVESLDLDGDGEPDQPAQTDTATSAAIPINATASGPILWVAAGFEVDKVTHPYVGDPGSKFAIQDAGGEKEPVAKVMFQDIKVLRVVRTGEAFSTEGSLGGADSTEEAPADSTAAPSGHLIVQVTPAQAEALTFMQDSVGQHTYQVVVRGKDDHERVETTGITFSILASNDDWGLPWPQSVTAPDEDNLSSDADATGTPAAEASPVAASN